MKFARVLLIAGATFGTQGALAQCYPQYTWHAFGYCDIGAIWLDCSPDITDVEWSNGMTGPTMEGPPGIYSYIALNGTDTVNTGTWEIEQLEWTIYPLSGYWGSGGYTIYGDASVPYCATAFNMPCCIPDPGMVTAELIQDGSATIGVLGAYVDCSSYSFSFDSVPTGHWYAVRIVDAECGSTVTALDTFIVNSCTNLALITLVQGTAPGMYAGEIQLVEVVPDTTEPYPLYPPVLGWASLYQGLAGYDLVDVQGPVSSAVFTGLDTGYYRLEFMPEANCVLVIDTLYVPPLLGTGLTNGSASGPEVIHHGGTDEFSVSGFDPGEPILIEVHDVSGRRVLALAANDLRVSLSSVRPGIYAVVARQGSLIARSKLCKR